MWNCISSAPGAALELWHCPARCAWPYNNNYNDGGDDDNNNNKIFRIYFYFLALLTIWTLFQEPGKMPLSSCWAVQGPGRAGPAGLCAQGTPGVFHSLQLSLAQRAGQSQSPRAAPAAEPQQLLGKLVLTCPYCSTCSSVSLLIQGSSLPMEVGICFHWAHCSSIVYFKWKYVSTSDFWQLFTMKFKYWAIWTSKLIWDKLVYVFTFCWLLPHLFRFRNQKCCAWFIQELQYISTIMPG